MGYPMAGHLARADHRVCVFNRTRKRAEAWVKQFGGMLRETPADAAEGADFVFSCVGNDDDLRSIVLGKHGAFAAMKTGAIYIDHTTASAKVARELAVEASRLGLGFLDAPVSGGQSGAEAGQLSIMVGGDPETFERAAPVLRAYAKAVTLIGPTGSGQLTKMVNQICLAGLTQALSEALAFALASGLDTGRVLAAISQGAAQSWMMDHRAQTMVEDRFDFGFAVDWMRKDLSIALDEARQTGATLPVTAIVDQLYAEVQKKKGGRLDITSLIRLLR
jgi:3-hydroxyisobutyrate dehydrogenase-like beta-hydroxyacid dehydrogenase